MTGTHDETRELLVAAREIIADPERWTKGAPAKATQDGCILPVYKSDATCWCITGAIELAWLRQNANGAIKSGAVTALWHVLESRGDHVFLDKEWRWRDLQMWNDEDRRDHPEVLELFDTAIERMAA